MSSHLHLTMACPHCRSANSITTADLPIGTLLGCSRCGTTLAFWRGPRQGFEPLSLTDVARVGESEGMPDMERRA
ncbi:hypothetical protein [Devosia soli]|uniref:hypothetical protein n=1 Tax=Devosia soli TaxID=361041 RepID=UPI00128CDC39|nr:hypothetical protein [Devosia soli]